MSENLLLLNGQVFLRGTQLLMDVNEYKEVIKLNNRLCRFVDRLVLNRELTRDIVQDAYLKLWECKENVQFVAALSWLFTTSYRISLKYLQENKRKLSEDSIPEIITFQPNPDVSKIIQDSLLHLSEIQRSVLMLRDYEGYSYEEIGKILGLSESQVKVYLFRSRKKIKEVIKNLDYVI